MDTGARAQAERRLGWLAGGILLWCALIFLRLILLQVVHHRDYVRLAERGQTVEVEIPAPRGSIFDRAGRLLAMSIPVDSVFVNPLQVPDLRVASDIFSRILGLDRSVLYGRLKRAYDRHTGFLWIKRKISPLESERLRSLHLDWIDFERESQRHYPGGEVAAHVLGSVDHQEQGNAGIEQSMDAVLRGQTGSERLLTDVKRRGIASHTDLEARAGTPLTLSIDQRIQFVAERELARAIASSHAWRGSVVVMNPYSGEVLAMASYPTFDPNRPPAPGENPACRFNQAVSVPFEPGSVYKVITLSAALETTRLRPESIINCGNGTITLFGRTIHEAHHGYGSIPMAMVLAKSSNIGAIQIGLTVGAPNFYEYVRRFGFGSPSGIALPGESRGMLRKIERWGKTSLASMAMGHEIGTTTLQLARACAVIANGGLLIRPKIVLRRGNAPVPSETPKRILKPETAITMRKMMEGVVLFGTGRGARLDGYTSGGKTGSAQIFDFATHHFTHFYNASYMGFAPLTNPAIVVVVTVNGTHLFGGVAAAPVFKAVAEEALRDLDVPKDLPDTLVADKDQSTTDVDDAAIADLGDGQSNVMEEEAAEEKPAAAAPALVAAAAQPAQDVSGPKVPDFQGKTMRAVIQEASAKGLQVLLDGSGIARMQQPPPGSVLHPGERIRVQFAR